MKIITDLTPTPENQEIIYNALDTMQTMGLQELYEGGLIPDWAVTSYTYSEKMLGPIMTMMRRGVLIDLTERDRIVSEIKVRAETVNKTFDHICTALFDTTININSPLQLKVLFFEFLGIAEQTKSKKGEVKVSLDREVLERIARDYPRGALFANFIMRIRDLEKQVEFLTKSLSPAGRFHTSYNVSGTETFRLSSSEHPLRIGSNQQNIPKIARSSFISDPGYTFFQADQQGAEARIVAYESGDENYIAACEGGDSHTMVAAMVFGFDPIRELAERNYYRDYSYRDLTKRGAHGCLTADHEVLTPSGWVNISEQPARIAAWSTDGTIRWSDVTNWIAKSATNLVEISGPSIYSLSTEDHKFVVNADDKFIERTATTLRKSDKIPYTGIWLGGNEDVPLAALVAAYQADGSESKGAIRWKFRRPRKIARMRDLLRAYNLDYTQTQSGKDTIFRVTVASSYDIIKWGKFAGPQMLSWDQASLFTFVAESIEWDGTRSKSGREAMCSVNLEHCRWMQTLYQLTGFGSKVIDNSRKMRGNAFGSQRPHWVSKNSRRYASLSSCSIVPTKFPTPVMVYCPTVTTGYFMVRSQGHIYVTGNSNYYGKPFTIAKNMQVEVDVAEQFQAKYFKRFPGIPAWHAHKAELLRTQGWIDNPFKMRRYFWGRKWDDATLREAIAYGPQSTVGVLTNIILHKLWDKYEGQPGAPVQILMNGHDAVIGQIRTDLVDTLVPQLLKEMEFPFEVTDINGVTRTALIPFDMELGGNWGKYDPLKNPTGLRKWKPPAKEVSDAA